MTLLLLQISRSRLSVTDSDGVLWPGGDTVVPEDRYHALRMVNGVGEG